MDNNQAWKAFFQQWPAGIPQRGVLVTCFGEQIAFVGFLTSNDMLVIERQAPDTVGARKVVLPFAKIDAVKVVDPVKIQVFTAAGFQQTPAKPA